MGRIKQGLDYFPLNTDFMHDRVVRRVMKREGDSAFTILLYTLSYLYSGEGYYIHVDDDFYDELSDQLFSTDNDSVRRVLRLFVEYGFFDSSLYERYGILTSADIQRQFLFIHLSPAKRPAFRRDPEAASFLPHIRLRETHNSRWFPCPPRFPWSSSFPVNISFQISDPLPFFFLLKLVVYDFLISIIHICYIFTTFSLRVMRNVVSTIVIIRTTNPSK